jgi:hypothetical protein
MIAVIEYVDGRPKEGDSWMPFEDDDVETWKERFRGLGHFVPEKSLPEKPQIQFFRLICGREDEEHIFAVDTAPSLSQEC